MSDPVRILVGDCLEAMRGMDAASVDAIVTDPPYGLSFMGKHWDHGVPGVDFWVEALRVAKPGTHLLAFGGTRTYHRLACAIEDAGWEVRDCIAWVYGSGFPKSLDVSKAIDKEAGAEREVIGDNGNGRPNRAGKRSNALAQPQTVGGTITAPATDLARQWSGWGTALKPAFEPIIVARKPLIGTVAENVTTHGTGAMNVDGCRVGFASEADKATMANAKWTVRTGVTDNYKGTGGFMSSNKDGETLNGADHLNDTGRWPANLIHDGSAEVVGLFPNDGEQSAARFFYAAKASKRDREEGLEGFCPKASPKLCDTGYESDTRMDGRPCAKHRNHHPTVKPTALMRYLCRLVTPPGGIVLDPFAGSGSTGKGAVLEGFNFIGIELDAEYAEIARARIGNATSADKGLFA